MLNNDLFSHGQNILGHDADPNKRPENHVDAIITLDDEGRPKFVRKATIEEIREFCK